MLKSIKRAKSKSRRIAYKRRPLSALERYTISTPIVFDLIDNCEEVCRFFIDLRSAKKEHSHVFIDASRMTKVTMEASLYLQALIHSDPGRNGSRVSGNYPSDEAVRKNWIDTGFFERLTTKEANKHKKKGEMILCKGTEQDAEAIRKVIFETASKLLGRTLKTPDDAPEPAKSMLTEINMVCTELRQNVVEHSAGQGGPTASWWIAAYPDSESGSLTVCIADAGIGIMESVNVLVWKKGASFAENVQRLGTTMASNADILRRAINGEFRFRVTSTEELHRGNGLRRIGDLAKKKFVDSVHVITNDARGEIKNSRFESLSTPMHGTIYVIKTNNIGTEYNEE